MFNYIYPTGTHQIGSFKEVDYEKEIDIAINDNNSKEKMSKYNVIFGGVCRNVQQYVSKVLDNIEKCGKKFAKFQVVIYENDSNDDTVEILLAKKKG